MLIALSGYARSGKDTVADILVAEHGFTKVAFADRLKAVLTDLDPYLAHTNAGNAACPMPYSVWSSCGYDLDWLKENTNVREYLQRLGVAARTHLGEDVWIKPVLREYRHPLSKILGEKLMVISDCRFPNEAQAVKDYGGGYVVRVSRPNVRPANEHVSEVALDDWNFDYTLRNGGPIEGLNRKVRRMLEVLDGE